VLAALLALDRDHHALLARILERLCAMSAEHIDREGGLYDALTAEEMLEEDVAADREERRAEAGHVAPADARAFLKLARRTVDALPEEHDPVTRAYFRGLRREPAHATNAPPRPKPGRDLTRLLVEAGVIESSPPLLPAAHATASREPLLVRSMRVLAEKDEVAFFARSEEIAYLANVLLSGESTQGRKYRPAEAVRKAIDVCSRGLELATKESRADPVEVLRRHPAEGLFRLAWSAKAAVDRA
jgi:hypothetical protein